jgi:hypothetical protein
VSVAVFMDEHVPSPITDGLRSRGVDVLTVQQDGHRGAGDEALLDRAAALARVLFSMDDDLLKLAARRQRNGAPFSGVVYAHPLRVSIGRCIADLERVAKACDPGELADYVLFLPL